MITMTYHGIVAAQRPNAAGQTINVVNLDISRLDHETPVVWGTNFLGCGSCPSDGDLPLGVLLESRKILCAADCRSDSDRGLFDLAGGVPLLRCTIEIATTAPSATAIAKAVELKALALSMAGHVSLREGSMLHRVVAHAIVLSSTARSASYQRMFPGRG
jgi:hypothetical protein